MGRTEKSVRLCYSGLQIQGTANSPPITAVIVYPIPAHLTSVFVARFGNFADWRIKQTGVSEQGIPNYVMLSLSKHHLIIIKLR